MTTTETLSATHAVVSKESWLEARKGTFRPEHEVINPGPRTDRPAFLDPAPSKHYKDESGRVFHTYSTYGRGLDSFIAAYSWLDLTPKGSDEDALTFPMAWVRHHDKYEPVAAAKSEVGSCCHTEE